MTRTHVKEHENCISVPFERRRKRTTYRYEDSLETIFLNSITHKLSQREVMFVAEHRWC